MIDCKKFIDCGKCKGDCCGIVPIPKITWGKFKNKAQRKVIEILDFYGDTVLPVSDEATCPFLDKNYRCVIYKNRPDVCKKFGDASHPLLVCPHKK